VMCLTLSFLQCIPCVLVLGWQFSLDAAFFTTHFFGS
jgi:hypothetical protein